MKYTVFIVIPGSAGSITNQIYWETTSKTEADLRLNVLKAQGYTSSYIRSETSEVEDFQWSRRSRVDLLVPAEQAIRQAVERIEELGCSIGLTEAINHLHKARELVADFIDKK